MAEAKRQLNAADKKRIKRREQLWPGSKGWVWDIYAMTTKGFATMSRLMPWVMTLIDELAGARASTVYLELWCRDFGQGIITITDEEACAFAAGYTGNRSHRTWSERMNKLVEKHFILSKREGNREYGQILLLDPLAVCAYWQQQGKVKEEWWNSFTQRASDIGADIPMTFGFGSPNQPPILPEEDDEEEPEEAKPSKPKSKEKVRSK